MSRCRRLPLALLPLAALPLVACVKASRVIATGTPAATAPTETAAHAPDTNGSASSTGAATTVAPPAAGDHAFAARLYGTQRGREGNLVLSPASARVALAMAYVGAKGDTAKQMGAVLGFDADLEKVATEVSATVRAWNAGGDPKVTLRVANATWGERTLRFASPFLDAMKDRFAAPLQKVDFTGAFEPARLTINDWIAKRTEHEIRDTLQEGDLDTFTRFVLVNATYFHGKWSHAFKASETRQGAFHGAPGRDVQRALMHEDEGFRYAETPDAQILSMPYGEAGKSAYSMVVVLPTKTFGLAEIEEKMTGATIDAWLAAPTTWSEVIVTFPKLTAEARVSLGAPLADLGMRDAFDKDKADFSGIAPHEGRDDNLFLSKVIQRARVSIDEEGTEAAAATVVVGAVPESPPPRPIVFEATHPFLWFLHDGAGNVLFMGRVSS